MARLGADNLAKKKDRGAVHRRSLKNYIYGGVAGVLVVAGVSGYIWWSTPVIDRAFVADAGFTVYAPRKAPKGYVLEEDKTRLGGTMLTYTFHSEREDRDIVVTVQPLPSGFDMGQMTEGGSIDPVTTAHGMLYNLSAGGTTKYLLNTGDSLIFLTSSTAIDTASITVIVNSLVKLN